MAASVYRYMNFDQIEEYAETGQGRDGLNQGVDVDEAVGHFAAIHVLVVAFASLVVVTHQTLSFTRIHQTVLERVRRGWHRCGHLPNHHFNDTALELIPSAQDEFGSGHGGILPKLYGVSSHMAPPTVARLYAAASRCHERALRRS
jgi:hypothetical protein